MDQETLFTATKWDILKALSSGKKSPMQLAEECSTSLANVSQQLRLLELGGVVSTERISNREKGQPRVLYSLRGNQCFLISTMKDMVEKQSMQLTPQQRATLAVWYYVDKSKQYFAEKALWHIHDHSQHIDGLYYDTHNLTALHFIVVTEKESLKNQLKEITIEKDSIKIAVKYTFKNSSFKPTQSHINLYG